MPHDAENRRLVEQACVEFERDLRAFLLGVLRDSHLADDALQKTVIKAIQASDSVNPETVRGWLFRIALNEARELKRGISRQGRLHKAVWESVSDADRREDKDAPFFVATEEEKQAVRQAMNRLSEDFREVVTRRVEKGQTFAVIAEEMGRPLGTVLTWMRRALLELAEMQELRNLSEHD